MIDLYHMVMPSVPSCAGIYVTDGVDCLCANKLGSGDPSLLEKSLVICLYTAKH